MEIMGGLIRLESRRRLPIPWFMRPHLGLETGSRVWFSATKPPPSQKRLPDILVSPLDPRHFSTITSVTLSNGEGIGTLAEVLSEVHPPINIALADSVTLEDRTHHRINLVLENAQGGEIEDFKDRRADFIKRFSPAPGESYDLGFSTIYRTEKPMISSRKTDVDEGMINIGDLIRKVESQYERIAEGYDLDKVVVSSNPDQRLIRYIIPKKGIVTLKLHHEDSPGFLHKIAKGLADEKYNILCSRLSRAKTGEDQSTFVCECEPSDRSIDPDDLIKKLERAGSIYGGSVHKGASASDVLYPKPAGSINVRPHEKYRKEISEQAKEYRGRRRLFLSRRFVEWKEDADPGVRATYAKVLGAIRTGAESAGWVALEAPPNKPDGEIDQAVYPRLWLADAFLFLAFLESGKGALSPNQAMELGFARGQNKPSAILIETNRIGEFNVSNHSGRTFLDYALSNAFEAENDHSISEKVRAWLLTLVC